MVFVDIHVTSTRHMRHLFQDNLKEIFKIERSPAEQSTFMLYKQCYITPIFTIKLTLFFIL